MTQEIRQDGDRFVITLRVAYTTTVLDVLADGTTVTRAEMPAGEEVEATATVAGDVLSMRLAGPEGPRRVDRQRDGERLRMTLTHLEAGASTLWTFERTEATPPAPPP